MDDDKPRMSPGQRALAIVTAVNKAKDPDYSEVIAEALDLALWRAGREEFDRRLEGYSEDHEMGPFDHMRIRYMRDGFETGTSFGAQVMHHMVALNPETLAELLWNSELTESKGQSWESARETEVGREMIQLGEVVNGMYATKMLEFCVEELPEAEEKKGWSK